MSADDVEATASDDNKSFTDHVDNIEPSVNVQQNSPSRVIAEDVKATLAQRLDLRINEQQKVGKILSQYPQSLFGYSKDMQDSFSNVDLNSKCHNDTPLISINLFLTHSERLSLYPQITVKESLRFFFDMVTIPGFWKKINAKANISIDLGSYNLAALNFVFFLPPHKVQHPFLTNIKEYPILFSTICCMMNGQNFSLVIEKFVNTFGDDLRSDFRIEISRKLDMIQQFILNKIADDGNSKVSTTKFSLHCNESFTTQCLKTRKWMINRRSYAFRVNA